MSLFTPFPSSFSFHLLYAIALLQCMAANVCKAQATWPVTQGAHAYRPGDFVVRYAMNRITTAIIRCLLLLCALPLYGQSADQNYIVEREWCGDGATHRDAVYYYDGLGRQVETVRDGFAPQGCHAVQRRRQHRHRVRLRRLRAHDGRQE